MIQAQTIWGSMPLVGYLLFFEVIYDLTLGTYAICCGVFHLSGPIQSKEKASKINLSGLVVVVSRAAWECSKAPNYVVCLCNRGTVYPLFVTTKQY